MISPKFVLSKKVVIDQYNKIKYISDNVTYSSKTNQEVTKILEDNTDSMFSIHSHNELKHIKDKSRVIFLAQGWDEQFIKELLKLKINYFIVDNESDLDVLLQFLENYEHEINLMLRIKLKEHSVRTEKYFVFGLTSDVVNTRLAQLKNNNKIKTIGVHFHRKTQNMSEWNLKYELLNTLSEEAINCLDYVNIGGGLPSEYVNTNINVFDSIFNKIKELKIWLNEKNIKMFVEPGRFIAAPAVKLITNIIGIHENNIIVNASVYNSDMDAIIVPVKLLVEGELSKGEGKAYVIKGVTPCSMDIFRYKVYLNDVKVGDECIFLNAGAYNFTSDFCDLEKLKTEVVE